MNYLEVAGGRARISTISPALLRLTWKDRTIVSAHDARRVVNAFAVHGGGTAYAVLVDVSEIHRMSLEAHQIFSRDHRIIAAAMLGTSPMDRMLSAGAEHASHPVRFFTTDGPAVSWLETYLFRLSRR